ncbi:MAG: GntR family transcriptional regulator [Burkholderiales bacterium]|nr:GntR family transcriptional regulator [Burkholderiales bacterium]
MNAASGLTARLASRVVDYIRRSGLAVGSHLPEQRLADAFRVSRTPVRHALHVLAGMGVVARRPRHGYFLRRVPAQTPKLPIRDDAALAEERYLRIADDRLAGKLEDQVTETALMRRYGLRRRELQRTLHRMQREGWIERKPGHGWMFATLPDSVEAHAQSYRFRMLFEPAALLEPGFRIDRAELERIRRDQRMLLDGGVHRLSRARLFEIGSDFHETLVSFSGNGFMIDAIRRVNGMRRLLEYRAKCDRGRFMEQCREHLHLLDLLEQGDPGRAAAYLRRHLDLVREKKTGIPSSSSTLPRHAATVTAQL